MPTPNPTESKDDFISRCIPILIREGKQQDEAVAICNSLWTERMSNFHMVVERLGLDKEKNPD